MILGIKYSRAILIAPSIFNIRAPAYETISWILCISVLSIDSMEQYYSELYNHVFDHKLWICELWGEIYDKTGRSSALVFIWLKKDYFYLIRIFIFPYFAMYRFSLFLLFSQLLLITWTNSCSYSVYIFGMHDYLVCIIINFISSKAA